ncbi:MAG: hypothetical protein IPK15_18715 [Verrucomicrobia bacterium]|nr:hypothetical protein [Verrucomicrobiota bacterium]
MVLDLAEFDLGLDLVPVDGLREQLDIDALLMGDPGFSFAHETDNSYS